MTIRWLADTVGKPLFRDQGLSLIVISQCLTGRKREAAVVPRRSASTVWIHLIIPEAEISRDHKHPEQGQKRNHC